MKESRGQGEKNVNESDSIQTCPRNAPSLSHSHRFLKRPNFSCRLKIISRNVVKLLHTHEELLCVAKFCEEESPKIVIEIPR